MVTKRRYIANKLNTTLFDKDITYKIVKPSHLEKLQLWK